jgi:metal-dependent amidase/aminoacylase/carboxypeptidase family protein
LFGPDRFAQLPHPLPVWEDFVRILENGPGAVVFLGACAANHDPATAPSNYSPVAEFDDALLDDGAALLANLGLSAVK